MDYLYNFYNHLLPRVMSYISQYVFVKVQMLKAYANTSGGSACSHKLLALACTSSYTFSCLSYLWLVQHISTSTICLASQLQSWYCFNWACRKWFTSCLDSRKVTDFVNFDPLWLLLIFFTTFKSRAYFSIKDKHEPDFILGNTVFSPLG